MIFSSMSSKENYQSLTRIVLLICASAILLLYFLTAWQSDTEGNSRVRLSRNPQGMYDLLTKNLMHGRLDLGVQPSEELLALPDPYPPQNRRHVPFDWDASYFGKKYYAYFGITPVATLLLPFYVLTGWFLPKSIAVAVFCSLSYLFSLFCALTLLNMIMPVAARGHFPPIGPGMTAFLTLGLGLGNLYTLLIIEPAMYEIAITAGLCFAMLGAFALCRSVIRAGGWPSYVWLATAGLSLGLAVGARPTLLLVTLLVIPVMLSIPGPLRLRSLSSFTLPFGLVGFFLALYNHLRFGAWWEFGRRYQLNREDLIHRMLSITDIWTGIRNFLLMPPISQRSWPFLLPRYDWPPPSSIHSNFAEPVIGVLWIFPLIPSVLCLFITNCRIPRFPRMFLTGMLLISSIMLVLDSLIGQCVRYSVECLSFLLIPAIVCAIFLADRLRNAFLKSGVLATLLATAAILSLLLSLRGSLTPNDGTLDDQLSHFQRVLTFTPDNIDVHVQVAQLLLQLGRKKEAAEEFERILEFDPNIPSVHNNLGLLLSEQGLFEKGLLHFRRAVALAPMDPRMHQNLADALKSQGDVQEAAEELQMISKLKTRSPEEDNP